MEIKHLLFIMMCFLVKAINAQTFMVESFTELKDSSEARDSAVYDLNNDICALVNVIIDASEIQFGNNVVKSSQLYNMYKSDGIDRSKSNLGEHSNTQNLRLNTSLKINVDGHEIPMDKNPINSRQNYNVYKAYCIDGSNSFIVKHPNTQNLRIKTSDYGIPTLKGGHTYTLKLKVPDYLKDRVGNLKENCISTGINKHYIEVSDWFKYNNDDEIKCKFTIFNGLPTQEKIFTTNGTLSGGRCGSNWATVVNVSDGKGIVLDPIMFRNIFIDRKQPDFPLFHRKFYSYREPYLCSNNEKNLPCLSDKVYIIGIDLIKRMSEIAKNRIIKTMKVISNPKNHNNSDPITIDIVVFDWGINEKEWL